MADISKIKLPGSEQVYNIKDQGARDLIAALPDPVTSITAGDGLTGGTITSTGTIALDTSYVATSAHAGLVPSLPTEEAEDKFLSGDGTWKKATSRPVINTNTGTIPSGTRTITVEYTGEFVNAFVVDSNNKLVLADVDVNSNSVIWKTEPLTSNANTFEIIGDNIVCGYGFTAEPDYLYILDRYTFGNSFLNFGKYIIADF